uniref:Uncharacterized protein n=1 Tax=Ciona intestinalis TaxID=7719 RepID=H2XZZ9_CIOIN
MSYNYVYIYTGKHPRMLCTVANKICRELPTKRRRPGRENRTVRSSVYFWLSEMKYIIGFRKKFQVFLF